MDDGHITDSQGRKVDFRNTVIIMTSNAGAQSIVDAKRLGFNTVQDEKEDYKKMQSNVMDEVKRIFRPEFLNRIDEIMVSIPDEGKYEADYNPAFKGSDRQMPKAAEYFADHYAGGQELYR